VTAGWSDGGVQHAGRPRSGPDREALAHQVCRLIVATVQSSAGPAALAAAATVVGGSAGPTRTLALRDLRPTLVRTASRFEVWITSIEGRRIRSSGRLLQDGVVTVEADGEFGARDRPLAATGRSPVRSDGGPGIPYCGDGSGTTGVR